MDVLRFTTEQVVLLFVAGVVAGGYGCWGVWWIRTQRKTSGYIPCGVVLVAVAVILFGLSVAFIVTHNPVAGGG
jgi:drug/metabolite transporter superfamily protein YnfA